MGVARAYTAGGGVGLMKAGNGSGAELTWNTVVTEIAELTRVAVGDIAAPPIAARPADARAPSPARCALALRAHGRRPLPLPASPGEPSTASPEREMTFLSIASICTPRRRIASSSRIALTNSSFPRTTPSEAIHATTSSS